VAGALLVIDMLNPYEHDDAEPLKESVSQIVDPVSRLVQDAQQAEVLTVYVNDNHGDWSASRPELVDRAMQGSAPELVEPVAPPPGMPFVVKARHSVFYETQLEYLLRQSEVDQLVLVGQVTEQCILYSALDAYVRHFEVAVPRNCVAHIHPDLAEAALRMMELNMRARITASGQDVLEQIG
jgi:nicotinamidase-related amidase